MGDETPKSTEILQGGEGGRGGRGGTGGHGGAGRNGTLGESGTPGEPGEPGGAGSIRYVSGHAISLWSSLGAITTVVLAVISGVIWIVDLKGDFKSELNAQRLSFENLDENIKSLNTPLSQRVFSVESRVNEIGRIQQEARARLDSIDSNGSTQSKIMKRDMDTIRSDISGQNIRCQEAVRRIDELQRDTLENKIRIQNLIEALSPHDQVRRK